MNIIFLDIDGVLNSHETCTKEHARTGKNGFGGFFKPTEKCTHDNVLWGQELVDNLKYIVEKTQAVIVISSTWRKHFTIEKFNEMFALYNFTPTIIGRTKNLNRARGFEIQEWLNTNTIDSNYVILDDDNDMLDIQKNNFINTDFNVGLTKQDAEKAVKILNDGK